MTDNEDLRARLGADEVTLRDNTVREVASGENNYDYREMWALLVEVKNRIRAINSDSSAFVIAGQHNTHMLTAWKGLLDSATKIIASINKMRNSDRLIAHILREHTASFTRALAQPLAAEWRAFDERLRQLESALASGAMDEQHALQHVSAMRGEVQQYVGAKLQTTFRDVAVSVLSRATSEYKLSS